jgi:hypothetical protein
VDGGGGVGEIPDFFQQTWFAALDRAHCAREQDASRGSLELGVKDSLCVLARGGQAVKMCMEAIVKTPEAREIQVG